MYKWISLKERLPMEQRRVIIYGAEGDSWWVEMAYLKDNEWRMDNQHFPVEEATHWMPLPEPPNE
jgi:hypothetical protein